LHHFHLTTETNFNNYMAKENSIKDSNGNSSLLAVDKSTGETRNVKSDPINNGLVTSSSPYDDLKAVTPSDSADLPDGTCRGLFVSVAGNISFVTSKGTSQSAIPVDAGFFPVSIKRVLATGTTATVLAGY